MATPREYARRRGVPLFPIGLGSDQPVRDLKLSDLLVDDVVFVDDVVNFECKLTATGFEGRKVPVVLREKDKPAVLAKVEVTVGPDGQPQPVRIPFRPTQVGQFEFVVEAEPQPGELQTENNRQTRTVEVRKEKIRVLLVQAYPSFEFRYLRNMLQRDETIALHTVLQEADLEHAEQDASALRVFPLRREELFAYDVVIFGDVNPALLSTAALQNLADFVDQPAKGGALVLIAGPSYMPAAYRETPLARLLPFAPASVRRPISLGEGRETNLPSPFGRGAGGEGVLREGFVVQPTDLGLASPAMQLGDTPEETREIWRNLAPLYWLLELPELKPGVRVLAEHPTRVGPDGRHLPVFCLQYVGAGKVLFHATDETWRWRYRVGDRYFARYWVQTIRYLCRAKLSRRRPPGRAHHRSPRVCPGRAGAAAGPICRRAAGPGRGRRRDGGGGAFRPADAAAFAASHGGRPGRLRGRARPARAGRLSRLDRRARLERSGAGGRFHGDSAGGRVRRDPHGRRRDAPRGPSRPAAASTRSTRPTVCWAICRPAARCPSNRCRRCRCGTSGPCWRCSSVC